MKNNHVRAVLFFVAGLVIGATVVFLQMQQYQKRLQHDAGVLLRTTLASSRLSALKTLRESDLDTLAAELETAIEGDRAALEAAADPGDLELMLIQKIGEYRKEHPFAATVGSTDGDE